MQVGVYGYGLNHDTPLRGPVPISSAKRLHKTIRDNFGTIVFCRRYLERLGVDKYLAGVSSLALKNCRVRWLLVGQILTWHDR